VAIPTVAELDYIYYATEMKQEVGAIFITNPHPPEMGGGKNLMLMTGKITIRPCLGLILL
jgi:hypothetical protein